MEHSEEIVVLLKEVRDLMVAQQLHALERERKQDEILDFEKSRIGNSIHLQEVAVGRQKQGMLIQRVALVIVAFLILLLLIILGFAGIYMSKVWPK